MKYWPLSKIAEHAAMPPMYARELRVAQGCTAAGGFSMEALQAAGIIANSTPAVNMPNLVVIESENGPLRRVFASFPTFEEWMSLERMGVVQSSIDGNLLMIVDAVH